MCSRKCTSIVPLYLTHSGRRVCCVCVCECVCRIAINRHHLRSEGMGGLLDSAHTHTGHGMNGRTREAHEKHTRSNDPTPPHTHTRHMTSHHPSPTHRTRTHRSREAIWKPKLNCTREATLHHTREANLKRTREALTKATTCIQSPTTCIQSPKQTHPLAPSHLLPPHTRARTRAATGWQAAEDKERLCGR